MSVLPLPAVVLLVGLAIASVLVALLVEALKEALRQLDGTDPKPGVRKWTLRLFSQAAAVTIVPLLGPHVLDVAAQLGWVPLVGPGSLFVVGLGVGFAAGEVKRWAEDSLRAWLDRLQPRGNR